MSVFQRVSDEYDLRSQQFDNIVNDSFVHQVRDHRYGSVLATMIFILYASMAAPALPSSIKGMFQNGLFVVVFLALGMYNLKTDPSVALITALGFFIGMKLLNEPARITNPLSTLWASGKSKISGKSSSVAAPAPVEVVPTVQTSEPSGIEGLDNISSIGGYYSSF